MTIVRDNTAPVISAVACGATPTQNASCTLTYTVTDNVTATPTCTLIPITAASAIHSGRLGKAATNSVKRCKTLSIVPP